jgi:hypothetical protein
VLGGTFGKNISSSITIVLHVPSAAYEENNLIVGYNLFVDRYAIDVGQSGPLLLYMKEHMALPLPVSTKT